MPGPRAIWTPQHDDQLLDLHAQDLSVRDIAERMGVSKSLVSRRARAAGLTFTRTKTRAATEAAVADAKARRAVLELTLLQDADRLRSQIWQPHTYIEHGGKDYVRVEWTQDEPSPTDKLKLMQAAGIAVDRSLKITAVDSDNGATEAVSMLQRLADAIGVPQPTRATP